jgi:hypothetical protein
MNDGDDGDNDEEAELTEVTVEITLLISSEFGMCMLLLGPLLWLLAAFWGGYFRMDVVGWRRRLAPGENWCNSQSPFLSRHYNTVHGECSTSWSLLELQYFHVYTSRRRPAGAVPFSFLLAMRLPWPAIATTHRESKTIDSQ